MVIKRRTTIWLSVLAVGILLIIVGLTKNDGQDLSASIPTPSSSTLSPAPSTVLATACQLSGAINFLSNGLYEIKGARLAYQNIDKSDYSISWNVDPDDGVFKIVPNSFSNFQILPSGEVGLGIAVHGEPTEKSYTLTASIMNGPDQSADCKGQVIITIP